MRGRNVLDHSAAQIAADGPALVRQAELRPGTRCVALSGPVRLDRSHVAPVVSLLLRQDSRHAVAGEVVREDAVHRGRERQDVPAEIGFAATRGLIEQRRVGFFAVYVSAARNSVRCRTYEGPLGWVFETRDSNKPRSLGVRIQGIAGGIGQSKTLAKARNNSTSTGVALRSCQMLAAQALSNLDFARGFNCSNFPKARSRSETLI